MELVYKEDAKKNVKKHQSTKKEKYQYSNIKEITFYQDANNGTTGKYDQEIVDFIPMQHDSSSSLPTEDHHLKFYRQTVENFCNKSLIISYWNSLSDNVVQVPNTKMFENRLDQYWRDYE